MRANVPSTKFLYLVHHTYNGYCVEYSPSQVKIIFSDEKQRRKVSKRQGIMPLVKRRPKTSISYRATTGRQVKLEVWRSWSHARSGLRRGMLVTRQVLPLVPIIGRQFIGKPPIGGHTELVKGISKTAATLNENISTMSYP